MMRTRTTMMMRTAVIALAMTLTVTATPAMAQEHGGSISNTHNDLWVVVGDVANDRGISPGPDGVIVQEIISFRNLNATVSNDYGIVFIPDEFTILAGYPRITNYNWTYQVKNYAVVLSNETSAFEKAYTGVTGSTFSLDPGDLGPDDPFATHPRANATYGWRVVVVADGDYNITTVEGGTVTTLVDAPTVIDLGPLDLPVIGQVEHVADEEELVDLTSRAKLTVYIGLKAGFYKFQVDDMAFMPGTTISMEVKYGGYTTYDGGVEFAKLLFTQRLVHVNIYASSDLVARVFSTASGTDVQLSPVEEGGRGEPITFETSSSFRVAVGPPADDGLTLGEIGRYALLLVIIGGLLFLALRGGRRRDEEPSGAETGEEGADADKEPGGGDDVDEDIDGIEDRIKETRSAIEGLQAQKASFLELIKELDRQHGGGDLPDDEWEEQRAEAKGQAVKVMKEISLEETSLVELEARLEDLS
jgi:hypothetical protein